MRSRTAIIATVLFCLLGFGVRPARAADASLANGSSNREGHVLSVSFDVEGAFTPKMDEAIQSGIPQTFTFLFEVYRVVTAWPDMRIYNWEIRRTIRYDTLTKTYAVDGGSDGETKHTKDFDEAKRWMTRFRHFPVAVAPALDPAHEHYIRVRAELAPVEWPLQINRVLFFADLWDFKTPWLRIDLPAKATDEPTPQPD